MIDSEDLLIKIFKMLGKQDAADLAFIKDDNIVSYCQKLMKIQKAGGRIDSKFTNVKPELRTILKVLCDFNPERRMSAKQVLSNKLFDDIRNVKQEEDAPFEVNMDLELPGCYDYETFVDNVTVKTFIN